MIARLGGPLTAENLEGYLLDNTCVRYRTEIVFDVGPLEPHQFAQPIIGGPEHLRTCTFHVHPRYESLPERLPYFIAYFAAVINYGIAAGPELCEIHGQRCWAWNRLRFTHDFATTPTSAVTPAATKNILCFPLRSFGSPTSFPKCVHELAILHWIPVALHVCGSQRNHISPM